MEKTTPVLAMQATTDRHRHTLTLRNLAEPYTCACCYTGGGGGRRYSCDKCNRDLHTTCVTCPETTTFFMHPAHPLHLEKSLNPLRHCDVCGEHVMGNFYRCRACNFDVHPLCSELRLALADEAHPRHGLTYTGHCQGKARCSVCTRSCSGSRYLCDKCDVHVHIGCLHAVRRAKGGGGGADGRKSHSEAALPSAQFALKVLNAGVEIMMNLK